MDTNRSAETCAKPNPAAQEMCENRAPPAEQARLFEDYAPRVYHLARRLLGNDADAQDVTQDVFLQVMRNLSSFRGDAAFATWLYRIAVNTSLAFRRKRAVRNEHCACGQSDDQLGDGGHWAKVRHWVREPEERALAHEQHQLIEDAIAKLPEKYRDVYVLADMEELPNTEISEMLGLGIAAVKSRLHRARLLMRRALASYVDEANS